MPAKRSPPCPYHQPEEALLVEDTYVVKLKQGHSLDDHFAAIKANVSEQTDFVYLNRLNTYIARIHPDLLHEQIRYDPGVELVEHDHYLSEPDTLVVDEHDHHISDLDGVDFRKDEEADRQSRLIDSHPHLKSRSVSWRKEQTTRFWWLSAITKGKKDDTLSTNGIFEYYEGAGDGVDIYVLDSGIYTGHTLFQGRATDYNGKATSKYTGGPAGDEDGHGTHVASIAAMVAPYANIINVKIKCKRLKEGDSKEPNCKEGTAGGMTQAIVDIADDHDVKKRERPNGWRGSVINISAAQKVSNHLAEAIASAKSAGIPIAAAAGNNNSNKVSLPCSSKSAICVGASTIGYKKAGASNFGEKVDIIAPGDPITAAGIGDKSELMARVGTSMAAPMVAGTMAIFVGYEGLDSNFKAVSDRLKSNALSGVISGFDDKTTDLFVNSGINNPKRPYDHPYFGVPVEGRPHDELKAVIANKAVVASQATPADSPAPAAATLHQVFGQPTGYHPQATVRASATTDVDVIIVTFTAAAEETLNPTKKPETDGPLVTAA